MGFLLGLVSNVVANVVFWVLLGAVFWAVSKAVARRFARFFGLVQVRAVAVYMSNLWVSSAGRSGRAGATLALHELRAAQAVDRLFNSAPLQLPELVRGLVDALWLRHPVRCAVEVSPLSPESADLDRNLIIVGSSARNSLRAQYLHAGVPSAILAGEDGASDGQLGAGEGGSITIWRNGGDSEINLANARLAIVEKCRDPARGTVLFFCLGARSDTTWAATEYLVRNWKRLDKEFADAPFVICLGFPGGSGSV